MSKQSATQSSRIQEVMAGQRNATETCLLNCGGWEYIFLFSFYTLKTMEDSTAGSFTNLRTEAKNVSGYKLSRLFSLIPGHLSVQWQSKVRINIQYILYIHTHTRENSLTLYISLKIYIVLCMYTYIWGGRRKNTGRSVIFLVFDLVYIYIYIF